MGLFSKFFKKKDDCPECGEYLGNLVVFGTSASCPACGYDITDILESFDTRTQEEKQIENNALKPLADDEELLAQRLAYLSRQQDGMGNTLLEAGNEIRKHGEYLGANGGTNCMKKIAYRVRILGGDVGTLQIYWDGICGWIA